MNWWFNRAMIDQWGLVIGRVSNCANEKSSPVGPTIPFFVITAWNYGICQKRTTTHMKENHWDKPQQCSDAISATPFTIIPFSALSEQFQCSFSAVLPKIQITSFQYCWIHWILIKSSAASEQFQCSSTKTEISWFKYYLINWYLLNKLNLNQIPCSFRAFSEQFYWNWNQLISMLFD